MSNFCVIDCAPSLGLLSVNALTTAREVIIPLQPHFLALQGLGKLLETVVLDRSRI
jgi:chromosome partitioning protein